MTEVHFSVRVRARGLGSFLDKLGCFFLQEDGTSLVESAISCVIVTVMIFGVVLVSWAVYSYHFISDAAREGSRYAMVRGSTSCSNTPNLTNCGATAAAIQTYVQSLQYPGINSQKGLSVNTTWLSASSTQPTTWSACSSGTCNAPGNLVSVEVTYNFPIPIPIFNVYLGSMTSRSEMVIAQ